MVSAQSARRAFPASITRMTFDSPAAARFIGYAILAAVLLALLAPCPVLAQTQPQFVFGATTGVPSIYAYQMNPTTGVMTPVSGSPFNERFYPTAMAVNPQGTFLFVTNGNGYNTVSVFSINTTTGALTEVPNSPFSTGLGINPQVVTTDASGQFLLVGNQTGVYWPDAGEYDSYTIDQTTGELTPTPGSTPPSRGDSGMASPTGVAYIHPNGRWIYITGGWNTSPDGIQQDQITLCEFLPSTGDVGCDNVVWTNPDSGEFPYALAGDPAGQFLYSEWGHDCVNFQSFQISQTDGSLTPSPTWWPATQAGLCSSGFGLGVDSTGNYLYSNIGSFAVAGGNIVPIQTSANFLPDIVVTDAIGPYLIGLNGSYSIDPTTGNLTLVSTLQQYIFSMEVMTGRPPQNPLPGAQYSPAGLTFTNSTVGVASAPQTIALYNTGTATLNISSISVTGANAADFGQTNTCAPSDTLAPGANCVFTVIYTPSTTNAESASISVSDNATGSPHTAALTATGFVQTPPDANVNPGSLNFLQTATGSSSSLSFTISNTGTETLTISNYSFTGSNPSDFSQTNNCGGSGGSVAGGANCTVTVTFTPQAPGERTAMLVVTSNSSSGPDNISLSGFGTTLSSPDTLTNTGPTSATVQAGQPATYTASVTPAAAYSGTINISCTVAPAGPTCSTSPTSVTATVSSNPAATPSSVTVNTSAAAALTPARRFYALYTNQGKVSATLGGIRWPLLLFGTMLIVCGVKWIRRCLAFSASREGLRAGALTAVLGICCALAACGGSSGTVPPPQPQNYTVTVAATSGANTQTVNLSLTVQ